MSHINVSSDWFITNTVNNDTNSSVNSKITLTGKIKVSPIDFEVREIPYRSDNDVDNDSTSDTDEYSRRRAANITNYNPINIDDINIDAITTITSNNNNNNSNDDDNNNNNNNNNNDNSNNSNNSNNNNNNNDNSNNNNNNTDSSNNSSNSTNDNIGADTTNESLLLLLTGDANYNTITNYHQQYYHFVEGIIASDSSNVVSLIEQYEQQHSNISVTVDVGAGAESVANAKRNFFKGAERSKNDRNDTQNDVQNDKQNNIENDTHTNTITITLVRDFTLTRLVSANVKLDDVMNVMVFFKKGPLHNHAQKGVRIGRGLSKDNRTLVFKLISSATPALITKTLDVNKKAHNSTNSTNSTSTDKDMLVTWSDKAMRKARIKSNSTTANNDINYHNIVDTNTTTVTNAHLSFVLNKTNVEHSFAVSLVSRALSLQQSNVAFCGIKDRKAVTYQYMSVPIRYDGSNKRKFGNDNNTNTSSSDIANFIVNLSKQLIVSLNASTDSSATSLSVGNFAIIANSYNIGGLWGNFFKIVIRDIRIISNGNSETHHSASDTDVDMISTYLNNNLNVLLSTGFPNFFGSQRMGYYNDDLKESDNDDYDGDWTDIGDSNDSSDNMPLGPQIGKLLLTGMKKKAVLMLLLGKEYYVKYIDRNTSINDDNDDDNDNARYSPLDYARRKFVAGVNLKKVLGLLPKNAVKERAILRGMIRYKWPGNEEDTEVVENILDCVSWSTKSLLVSSYQSWIWNKVSSYRLRGGLRPLVGDLVLVKNDTDKIETDENTVKSTVKIITDADVAANNISANSIVLPLFGPRCEYPTNDSGDYYRHLIDKEGIADYINNTNSSYIRKGAYRKVIQKLYADPIMVQESSDSVTATLTMCLPAGSYATTVLRELFHDNSMV